jgi:hypothetical protein
LRQTQELSVPLHVEHITARQHAGDDDLENLAIACSHCNLHKGTNLTSIDPESGQIVSLFHPRQQQWGEHFETRGAVILGLTAIGRATVRLLNMNTPKRRRLRGS